MKKEIANRFKALEKRITIIEEKLKVKPQLVGKLIRSNKIGKLQFDVLSKKTGLQIDKIKETYDFEGDKLTLLKTTGEGIKEKTKNTSLLVLLGYKYCFGTEEILSKEIKRNVAENHISVANFATYLNELSPALIRRKGKSKSPSTKYRLTTLGEVKAREILKKIIEGKNEQ